MYLLPRAHACTARTIGLGVHIYVPVGVCIIYMYILKIKFKHEKNTHFYGSIVAATGLSLEKIFCHYGSALLTAFTAFTNPTKQRLPETSLLCSTPGAAPRGDKLHAYFDLRAMTAWSVWDL